MQIAQVNIARMRAPAEHPVMSGFVARLDEINALADASPGFVWRLQSDGADEAVMLIDDDDPCLIVNLSVWETLGTLRNFVYKTLHRELLMSRTQWFEALDRPHLALWPVAAGHLPDVGEAGDRLAELARDGPSGTVFTFASAPAPFRV